MTRRDTQDLTPKAKDIHEKHSPMEGPSFADKTHRAKDNSEDNRIADEAYINESDDYRAQDMKPRDIGHGT